MRFIMFNQDSIRGEVYVGLADAIAANDDADPESLGQRIILPSFFTGSTHHMQQLLQDALAINRYFKSGDLFLTMTANLSFMLSMQSRRKSFMTLTLEFLERLSAMSSPLSFRNVGCHTCTASSFWIQNPSSALPSRWTAFFPQSFLRTILRCLSWSRGLWSISPVVLRTQ